MLGVKFNKGERRNRFQQKSLDSFGYFVKYKDMLVYLTCLFVSFHFSMQPNTQTHWGKICFRNETQC